MDYRQRRKEQAQQTEQAILQAAMELARENSFDKVSVRDICQRAGITTGAFYHHFRSKEDLLSRGFSPLDRHMEEALSGHETDAPPQRLWLILSTYASFIEAQGWELVARYYQRRLDAPDDASSMDPTRITHASITARPFFERRGWHVVKEQQVERRGVLLTNFVMERSCPPPSRPV